MLAAAGNGLPPARAGPTSCARTRHLTRHQTHSESAGVDATHTSPTSPEQVMVVAHGAVLQSFDRLCSALPPYSSRHVSQPLS